MLSAICFSLDQSKILSSGNGLLQIWLLYWKILEYLLNKDAEYFLEINMPIKKIISFRKVGLDCAG